MNWNHIKFSKFQNNKITKKLNQRYFYFVHSFYCKPENEKNILSTSMFNKQEFCSSILNKNILGTQFHPEKSGKTGIDFLRNINNFYEKNNKKKTLFGLPQKVIFCKKTLISNQRPTSSIEFHHNSKSKKNIIYR